jgi:hypothetical protein
MKLGLIEYWIQNNYSHPWTQTSAEELITKLATSANSATTLVRFSHAYQNPSHFYCSVKLVNAPLNPQCKHCFDGASTHCSLLLLFHSLDNFH